MANVAYQLIMACGVSMAKIIMCNGGVMAS
jgi:hypothetical protein